MECMSGMGNDEPILHDPKLHRTGGTSLILSSDARKRKCQANPSLKRGSKIKILEDQHQTRLPIRSTDWHVRRPATIAFLPVQALSGALQPACRVLSVSGLRQPRATWRGFLLSL